RGRGGGPHRDVQRVRGHRETAASEALRGATVVASMATPHPTTSRAVGPEALKGDLVTPGDPRYGVVWINPERMSGTPCFFGTRVPVRTLFESLEAGES